MRVPTESLRRPASRRRSLWLLWVLACIILLILLVEAGSALYTTYLWFHWTGVGNVFGAEATTKLGLGAVFSLLGFTLCFVSLLLVDKIAPRAMFMAPDTELVRRYQSVAGPHAVALRVGVSAVVGLALGVGTSSQWQHWLLFEHAVPFGKTDPLFRMDASFFVFRLPFLSFLVGWLLAALIVVFLLSMLAHFLNGAIRFQSASRIEPRALAHLSLLLGAIALVRAWGYYFVDRYRLDLSRNGVVEGAGYTDVHVRLPAITLLAVVSLVAFVMLVFNAYQRSLVLPAVAVGLWVLIAVVVGLIYPALVQAFKVTPAQGALESPYISDNIAATRFALGIDSVTSTRFPANEDLTPEVLTQYAASLEDSQLWDPAYVKTAFDKLQDIWPYFKLTNLTVERYQVNGKLVPVDVAVRELNQAGVASQSWVNQHLVYTHGYGAVISPSNTSNPSGNPIFDLGGLPPTSSAGLPAISQPDVYFAPGESGYVVADTKQAEVDYQDQNGTVHTSHYAGNGGVPIGSLLARAAFAVNLKDFNLLISSQITSHSRLITVPDIRARVQKALPFLVVDENPYAVVDHGQIDWVVDAYTTSSTFPYAQQAQTGELPPNSPLAGSYNYLRDAVKVVVNAYTGRMRFYVVDRGDPLIRSWERTFPGMFQPLAKMDATLRSQLRYPQELLEVQATMYGRYHVSQASIFYANSNVWSISATSSSTSGSPKQPLPQGANGQVAPYRPIYQLLQLPGQRAPSFEAVEPLVPYSGDGHLQTLSAILLASSAGDNYGHLEALVTQRSAVPGPGLANADILHDPTISKDLSLLDQGGSVVALGTIQTLPIADSLLYLRPLYVSSSQTAFPELVDVIVVYGKQVVIEPTLSQALQDVFGTQAGISSSGPTGQSPASSGGGVPSQVRRLLDQASADYRNAQQALASGQLGTYQADMTRAGVAIEQAQRLVGTGSKSPPKTSSGSSSRANQAGRTGGTSHSSRAAVSTTSTRARSTSTTSPPTVPREGSALAGNKGVRAGIEAGSTAGQRSSGTAGSVSARSTPAGGSAPATTTTTALAPGATGAAVRRQSTGAGPP